MSAQLTPSTVETAQAAYAEDGYYFTPSIIPEDLILASIERMDRIMAGEYETGVEPFRVWSRPSSNPQGLIKIDNPHESDRTIMELLTHPSFAQWAAALTGAKRLQIFATQLLYKSPQTDESGIVGWHRDSYYWRKWWTPESQGFTAWMSMGNVTSLNGPMCYVRGSHRWGEIDGGDYFWINDLNVIKKMIQQDHDEDWEEVKAILPAGGISFHNKHTLHGSGPNLSDSPRRSFVIHLCNENSEVLADSEHYYMRHLDDPVVCPIIYDEEA